MRIGMVGITGYGSRHLSKILKWEEENRLQLVSFCDIRNERTEEQIQLLVEKGKVFHEDYTALTQDNLDAVIISTPLHMHKTMADVFLKAGIAVYLEKPPVVLLDEIDELLAVQAETGAPCQVGFQRVAVPSVQKLIQLFKEHQELGAVKQISSIGMWARTDQYYKTSTWKGRLTIGESPILDGSVMNPLSHYLNQAFYFADALQLGEPVSVKAELYRGHDFIESEDTCCSRFTFAGGATLGYYTTLCSPLVDAPAIRIEFENGEAIWNERSYFLRVGEQMIGPQPSGAGDLLNNFIRHLEGVEELLMPLSKSRLYVAAANGIFASSAGIQSVPPEYVIESKERGGSGIFSTIVGIDQLIRACSQNNSLFSEAGVPWAVQTQEMNINEIPAEWKKWVSVER